MKTTTQKVADFHNLFEHPIGKLHEKEPLKIRQLRLKLLFEELVELAEAGDLKRTLAELCMRQGHEIIAAVDTTSLVTIHPKEKFDKEITEMLDGFGVKDGENVNRVEELDALCDLQYVLDGKKVTSGLHEVFEQAFDLVHNNNMQKAHRSHEHASDTIMKTSVEAGVIIEREGKFLVMRGDGKLVKPHDHKKVDLSVLFKTQSDYNSEKNQHKELAEDPETDHNQ